MKRFFLCCGLIFLAGLAGAQTPDARLSIAPPKEGAANAQPKLAPAAAQNFTVYREPGRYGGWPANHGLWQWGDELVVGFDSTWYKATTTDHRIDRTQPSYAYQARSHDGGRTWATEPDLPFADATKEAARRPLTEPLDFTAPDFALMFRFGGLHVGPSWFYTTVDRCGTWQGPYTFAVPGLDHICTRTDLVVLGPQDCLMFGSCAKQNDGKEGRPFCARTVDGGVTWKLVSLIGPEPVEGGYAIMPSTLRLPDGALLTLIRRSDPKVSGFIEAWRSRDLGVTWEALGKVVTGIGGNPPALVQLPDGRVAVTYGFRHKPSGMRACISEDGGQTWGGEIILRGDAFDGDMGYPRSVVRPDGQVLTVYYYNGPKAEDRAIEATLWKPEPQDKVAALGKVLGEALDAVFTQPPTPGPAGGDWGLYSIIPVSAPALVLQAVGHGVTLQPPAGYAQQKWALVPKENGCFSLEPAHALGMGLCLTVEKGAAKNGAALTLDFDIAQPWQRWRLRPEEDGSFALEPQHAPGMGLDDFGGKKEPGARIDLWEHRPKDQHLQWFIRPLAGSPPPVAEPASGLPVYTPPVPAPEALKPGTLQKFTFSQSRIFPGTVREVNVVIPAQYTGEKPACVYVKTDGYNPREKEWLETMIATGEMPVTIGVFVRPGELPAPKPGTLGRRNRGLEYDGLGPANARFLVEELLPYIAQEYHLNLSQSGNDRCISGGSSGGITAWNAAWERPEWFSRVYCASGSFVAFRGGHEFPTLVRKYEAKPLRAYLTTGTRDMENAAGDWYLVDQEMDKALKFSGYDYRFRTIQGGHVAGYAEHWREAMAYLWHGWPAPVAAGPSAPRAQELLVPGAGWQPLAQRFQTLTAAACSPTGEVFLADPGANKIFRMDGEGKVSEFLADAGHANGLSFGADGQLYTVSQQTGRVMRYTPEGQSTVVLEGLPGHSVLALPQGGLYVTSGRQIWCVKDGAKVEAGTLPNVAAGLACRPDHWLLAVADAGSRWAWSYQMDDDGRLRHGERYFSFHLRDEDDNTGAGGACYAQEGPLLVATRAGVQVCADDGPTQIILPLPDHAPVTGVCLGGREGDTLFALSGQQVWQRKVKVHGMGAFTPWRAVKGSKL